MKYFGNPASASVLDEYAEIIMVKHPEIDIAWVTLNRACSLRCRWCYAANAGYRADDDMPLDLFRQIVDLVSGLGIRNVTLTGGEPTIYPHILEAIRYCKDHGLNVTIPTNGPAFAPRYRLEQFCEAGVDRIGVCQRARQAKLPGRDGHRLLR